VILVALVGCGGNGDESGAANGTYPLVTPTQPKYQPPVTTPGGAVVQRPVPPTEHEVTPSPTCERMMATFHDGSTPTRRPIVVPPEPGLRAVALTKRKVRLEWSFQSLPDDCRPTRVALSVVANSDADATPTTVDAEVNGKQGTKEITYPDFLPPPDVALASAYTREGYRSRTVSVLISR
jgi:hypothetical protein